jgi:biotin carboxyl carrier protein
VTWPRFIDIRLATVVDASSGEVTELACSAGEQINPGDELMRIKTNQGTHTVTSPTFGWIMSAVSLGATVYPSDSLVCIEVHDPPDFDR